MCKRKGFSLIELMIVMLIIGLAVAGVSQVVNPSGSTAKRINRQGDLLFAQMQFALDDALLRFSALGIALPVDEENLESTNYSWLRYNGEEWEATESPLGEQAIEEGFGLSIEVDEESIEESLDDLLEEDEERLKPVIVFYPSGEISEFSMVITLSDKALQSNPDAGNQRYKITLNQRGQLKRFFVGEEDND